MLPLTSTNMAQKHVSGPGLKKYLALPIPQIAAMSDRRQLNHKLEPRDEHGFEEQLCRSAAMDLVNRLRLGTFSYPLVFVIIGVATPLRADHPFLFWVLLLICLATVAGRGVIAPQREKIYRRSPKLLKFLVFASVMPASVICGGLYLSALWFYGMGSWTFAIVSMVISGFSSGSTISFTPNFKLLSTHISLLFAPVIFCALYMGGSQGYSFVVLELLMVAFLVSQGHRLHRMYWTGLRNVILEAARRRELEAAKAAAVAANMSKSAFLANTSHEVRTPMHGILGMAQLAMDAKSPEESREYIRILRQSAEGLLTVLNDILDFSKIEAGKLSLEKTSFSVRRLIADTQNLVVPQAAAKGLSLSCSAAEDVPDVLVGDPARLRQVLINLVGNAVKFTAAGSVQLLITRLPANGVEAPGEHAAVHFRVADTGIGIPEKQQKLIFEAFAQADASVTRRFGGTGLGLAICSQLVELMGGKLTVESAAGKGSSFQFTCDFAIAPPDSIQTPQETLAPPAPPMRILLAEDNPISQKLATKLLSNHGHDVRVVVTGKAAVEAWEQEEFDLILMDNQMPEMDGIDAVREIRARESQAGRPRTPIIACSASAMTTERQRFLAAGMDDNLCKPFCAEDLYRILRNYAPVTVTEQVAEKVSVE